MITTAFSQVCGLVCGEEEEEVQNLKKYFRYFLNVRCSIYALPLSIPIDGWHRFQLRQGLH